MYGEADLKAAANFRGLPGPLPTGDGQLHVVGLASMEERVRLIQGDLAISSQPGRGTLISVQVPLLGSSR